MKKKIVRILLVCCLTATLLLPSAAIAASSSNYTLTGNYADDVVAIAVAQAGKTWNDLGAEMTAASNGISYKGAWCGNFVWWCGYKAGLVSNGFFPSNNYFPTAINSAIWLAKSGNCKIYIYNNFYNQFLGRTEEGWRSYADAGIVESVSKSFAPQKGDIIIYGKPQSNQSRVTITHTGYIRQNTSNGTIYTVEGSTGSGVKLRNITVNFYDPSYLGYPIGYVRPNYPSSSNPLPSGLGVSTDKETYPLGESVLIGPYADNASHFAISIWLGAFGTGKQLYADYYLLGGVVFDPPQTGTYTIRADAKNSAGYISTEKVFTVVPSLESNSASVPEEKVWRDWSNWSTNYVAPSDTRQVETRSVKVSDGYEEYRYGRYVDSAHAHDCWCKQYFETKRAINGTAELEYTEWSRNRYSPVRTMWTCGFCNGNHIGVHHIGADGRAWWSQYSLPAGKFYWEESRQIEAVYETQYRYRDLIC